MLELEEAQKKILEKIRPLNSEVIPLNAAYGRVLAEKIVSPIDLPPFDNSAMDGYAVRAEDLVSSEINAPVALQLAGKIAAGEDFSTPLEPGTCVRIFTGSPVPSGADAVVMQEETFLEQAQPEKIFFNANPKPWENIRLQGEDVKKNSLLVDAGERVSLGKISLFAALGIETVCVGRQPVVGLLATGSELVEAGERLLPGKIYESNRIGLAILTRQFGAIPKIYPLVKDDLSITQSALEKAFAECDVVVTSGGVSVGEFDFIKAAFDKMGGQLDFWKISIRPGKPFVFGEHQGKFLFGLPGNPISSFVTFLLLARPALLRLQGAKDISLPVSMGNLAEPLVNKSERRHFARVKTGSDGQVFLAGIQASHILSGLAEANGLVEVPPQTVLPVGKLVAVLRWE